MVAGYLVISVISGPSVRAAALIAPALAIVVLNGLVRRPKAGGVSDRRVNARPFRATADRAGASRKIGGTVPACGGKTHVSFHDVPGQVAPDALISLWRFA